MHVSLFLILFIYNLCYFLNSQLIFHFYCLVVLFIVIIFVCFLFFLVRIICIYIYIFAEFSHLNYNIYIERDIYLQTCLTFIV